MTPRFRTMEGPEVTTSRSCMPCIHMRGAPGEDGVGVRVTCSAAEGREIGWSAWKTPEWCPVIAREVQRCEAGIAESRRLMGLPPECTCATTGAGECPVFDALEEEEGAR